jgi:hypothetical protein
VLTKQINSDHKFRCASFAPGYLQKIHNAVLSAHEEKKQTGMELCKQVVNYLGLPPFVANPLLVKAFTSSLVAGKNAHLFEF